MSTADVSVEQVTSKDGSTIAYDRLGAGPPLILISGGSVGRSSNAGLAERLSEHFSVYNYDRRGRGPSGDTQPYSPQREVEDLEAVIDAAGAPAHVFGTSSGAALAIVMRRSGTALARRPMRQPLAAQRRRSLSMEEEQSSGGSAGGLLG